MSVQLKKNESTSFKGTKMLDVGLGWDCNETGGTAFDLDAWAIGIKDDKMKQNNFVYFGNKQSSDCYIHHRGDNLTGEGDGDDEVIDINLSNSSYNNFDYILLGVTIYRGYQKGQTFKDVNNAFIRIAGNIANYNDKEFCRYDISAKRDTDIGDCTTLLFGALINKGKEDRSNTWEFKALGIGSKVSAVTGVRQGFADYKQYLNSDAQATNINNKKEKKTMAVSLSKGGKVSLAKVAQDAGIANLSKVVVGLGWDTNRYDGGAGFDLDASAFMTCANGKCKDDKGFIFYGNTQGAGVTHTGDNRTGDGDDDDEQILVDLNAVPADIEKVAFTVTIYDADVRNQNFGMVENAYIRIADEATGTELIRYDLGEDFSIETAVVVGELYRHNGEWKFNAIGSGFSGGLKALCANYGIDAE